MFAALAAAIRSSVHSLDAHFLLCFALNGTAIQFATNISPHAAA
jgi:hypothetical protein